MRGGGLVMDSSNLLDFSIVGSYRYRRGRDSVNHSFASAEGRSGRQLRQRTGRKKYTPDIIDITVRFGDWIIKNGTENL